MNGCVVSLVVALAVAMSGCKRPSVESCEEALRNYAQLMFWEKAEQQIAAAPAAEREAMRAAKIVERDTYMKEGLDMAIAQCRSAADFDGVKCMKAAHTAAAARACRKPW
jgi:hypothetical protein